MRFFFVQTESLINKIIVSFYIIILAYDRLHLIVYNMQLISIALIDYFEFIDH